MNRYLIHFSYIGSQFKGVSRIPPYYNFCDKSTIQGGIEIALRHLKPANQFQVETSSRTDARVHALHTTLHVDLENKRDRPYDPDHLTQELNKKFNYTNLGIRILKTELVDPTYHVRENVAHRSYLYRLAVARKSHDSIDAENKSYIYQPIEEHDRCYFIHNRNFDVERMKRVTPLFVGKRDFRTFMSPSKVEHSTEARWCIRRLYSLTIEEGKPSCLTSDRQAITEDAYQFWNIRFQGRSFVYRQVRKIVGALIAVAEGKITEKDVYEMLTIPSYDMWPMNVAFTAPGHALFLTGVEYEEPEEDSGTIEKKLDTKDEKVNSMQA